MGMLRSFADGLVNVLTGLGTTTDPRSYNGYVFRKLTDPEIDAAFRGSWAIRKIITKPAADMTREWRDWQTDKATIEKLEAEEERLDVRARWKRAEVLRGLGGAGMVIYIKGDDPTKPIDPTRITASAITALQVWHRSCFSLGEPITEWGDPYFGHPSHYEMHLATVAGQALRLHPSRVIAFRGEETSGIRASNWLDAWWGDSTVDVIKEAVDNVHTGENGFAALIKDARNRRVYVPKLLQLDEATLSKRMQAFAMGESMYGATWLDGGDGDGKGSEKIEDRQMVWAGIPDIKMSNLLVAGAAGNMPATVLLGKSADGMNATGLGDKTQWDEEVKARQDDKMRAGLKQLDVALVPSALGKPDPSVWWKYAPLSTPTEGEEATTLKDTATGIASIQTSGLIPDKALAEGVQNLFIERGWLPGLDVALDKIPEDERYPEPVDPVTDPTDPSAITTPANPKPKPKQPQAGQ